MEHDKVLERKGSGVRGQRSGIRGQGSATNNPAFSGTFASLQPGNQRPGKGAKESISSINNGKHFLPK